MINICKNHQVNFVNKLRENKLKVTPARLEILDILEHESSPLTVEQIGKQMKTKKADIVTIYRNIEFLKTASLVRQVSLNTNQAHYELVAKPHHHHLVCESCGVVKDILECSNPKVSGGALKKSGFGKISFHSLEFFGLCNKCFNNSN